MTGIDKRTISYHIDRKERISQALDGLCDERGIRFAAEDYDALVELMETTCDAEISIAVMFDADPTMEPVAGEMRHERDLMDIYSGVSALIAAAYERGLGTERIVNTLAPTPLPGPDEE